MTTSATLSCLTLNGQISAVFMLAFIFGCTLVKLISMPRAVPGQVTQYTLDLQIQSHASV